MNTIKMMIELAKELEVDLYEEFNINNADNNPYQITPEGLINKKGHSPKYVLADLIMGKYTITKLSQRPNIGDYFYRISLGGQDIIKQEIFKDGTYHNRLFERGLVFQEYEDAFEKAREWGLV